VTNEEQINSIFSLIGKPSCQTYNFIDCLQVVVNTLGTKVEQFAPALISRAIAIVIPILGLKTQLGKVINESLL